MVGRPAAPPTLDRHAAENLRFIRDTMASAAGFTAVPGWGGMLMGITAIFTAGFSGPPSSDPAWLRLWLGEAVLAVSIGLVAIALKARRSGTPLRGPGTRRFALAFAPAIAAGAALTIVFVRSGLAHRLPGCWLLLYGAAVCSAGAFSVRAVPTMGAGLMALGVLALSARPEWGHMFMAAGFGGLQIVFGILIGRKHGG
jgi:hypothetical protein